MLVIAQAAAYLRLLRGWANRTGDHGFQELDPTTVGVGATGTPRAA